MRASAASARTAAHEESGARHDAREGVMSGSIGPLHPRYRGTAELSAEGRELAPRGDVRDVGLGGDPIEVDGGAERHHLQKEDADALGEVGLARVAVHERRERNSIADKVVNFAPGEELW
eukprot:3675646-Prymnesium_polylepis.1